MQLSNWLVPRMVRTALIATIFVLLLCLLLFRYPNLHGRIESLRPIDWDVAQSPNNASQASAEVKDSSQSSCNCSSTEAPSTSDPPINWSNFAYVQYVTNVKYLCNSLMVLEALRRFNTKADLVLMYPDFWGVPSRDDEHSPHEGNLLAKAREEYGAKLVPIQVRTFPNRKDPTWQDSYTKLLAFNQTDYKRVISLDSDATVLDHMDELFFLPPATVAMPRAYWMDKFFLSSQVIVIQPSAKEWARVDNAIEHHEGFDYDMDILNKMYLNSATIIPHRTYDMITGELSRDKHENFMGLSEEEEKWDPKAAITETKYVHFSDWPMPKPWLQPLPGMVEKHQPACRQGPVPAAEGESETKEDCSNREVWLELRTDFTARRKRVCGREWDGIAPRPNTRRSKYEPVFE